jgi:hypothetical protein
MAGSQDSTPYNDDDNNDNNENGSVKTRAFTVKGKRNPHKTYTFNNFSSARDGKDLFRTTPVSLEDKKALYDSLVLLHEATELRVESAASRGEVILGISVAEIPINYLTVDDAWARSKLVDWNHVADMAMDFHPKSVSIPSVAARCEYDDDGNLSDVIFSLTDGVHRTTTLQEKGYTHVLVSVQLVDSVREEAEISSDCNYGRRAHAGIDILKNRISSEEERALALKQFIEARGFVISMKLGTKSWPEIGAIPTVEKILRRYGEDTLARVLDLFSNPTFAHWFGNSATLRADMLAGWALYIHEFERTGFIHSAMTEHLLQNTTPVLIENLAEQINKPIASAVFNREMCPNAKDLNSEDGRGVKVCTALVRQVSELFKPSKRPKTNFLSKFKTAFDLFYSVEPNRNSELASVRNSCSRKGMPDYWLLRKNSGLTR